MAASGRPEAYRSGMSVPRIRRGPYDQTRSSWSLCGRAREAIERYSRALQDKDLDALALHFADDYVDEMPQSGERLVVPAYQPAGGVMPRSCPRSGLVNGSSSTILPSARR
jgi:hypothetical protein